MFPATRKWLTMLCAFAFVGVYSHRAEADCPYQFIGSWNGVYYYYAHPCPQDVIVPWQLTYVFSNRSHTLGCNGNMCKDEVTFSKAPMADYQPQTESTEFNDDGDYGGGRTGTAFTDPSWSMQQRGIPARAWTDIADANLNEEGLNTKERATFHPTTESQLSVQFVEFKDAEFRYTEDGRRPRFILFRLIKLMIDRDGDAMTDDVLYLGQEIDRYDARRGPQTQRYPNGRLELKHFPGGGNDSHILTVSNFNEAGPPRDQQFFVTTVNELSY